MNKQLVQPDGLSHTKNSNCTEPYNVSATTNMLASTKLLVRPYGLPQTRNIPHAPFNAANKRRRIERCNPSPRRGHTLSRAPDSSTGRHDTTQQLGESVFFTSTRRKSLERWRLMLPYRSCNINTERGSFLSLFCARHHNKSSYIIYIYMRTKAAKR